MENYQTNQETTNLYPVVPLRGRVTFPKTSLTFEVGRDMTATAVDRASKSDKCLFILSQRDAEKELITQDDLYEVGCVAKIKQLTQPVGGSLRVTCEVLYRASVAHISYDGNCFTAVCDPLPPQRGDEILEEAYFRTVKALTNEAFSSKQMKEALLKLERCEDADDFVNLCGATLHFQRLSQKQELLEERRVVERLKKLESFLNAELEIMRVEKKIAAAVRQNVDKNQKEYFLREQIKAINTELGEDGKESDEYRARILEKKLPQEVEVKCLKEVDRLSKMPSSAAEYTVIAGYLDQVLALPWTEETTDTDKLSDCKAVLEADHFGLEKIKERILEYLAVLKLTENRKAPILCFVGPPGVGKTSIAQSIARALGRKFVRMSLGGVKDEAEIRGHRRTYIGAIPGRILYGMKNAGTVNPVFLLDEIDKISADMHGDPASALLEVLDPEQNATFRDRFIEVPYDLSKVLFLTTANTLETIPAPLRDRMEIIELSGYTMEEKLEIARRYLVPKQLKANGISEKIARFTEGGLRLAVEGYTREAGVRSLERTVGSLCRKIAVRYADDPTMAKTTVDEAQVKALLGAPRFEVNEERFDREVGLVNGLAWTAVGGTTLLVEATKMAGKGEVKLTGKLGDVMKESALAALSYIRSNAERYGISPEIFEKTDLHIHVPEGATPKDGPSAGITIATAILSVLTGRKVRGDVAMTGEITLRGRVLPIGGLKEKSLAARRLGIATVLMPEGNKRDLEELPEVVKKDVTFIPVRTVDEVFERVLEGGSRFEETPAPLPKKRKPKAKIMPVLSDEPPRDGVRCK